jgi:hypothetical protein
MIFKPSERERAIIFMDKQFEAKKPVKIERVTETKSLSQNSYLWLVFTHIGFEMGSSKDEVYEIYLQLFPKFKEVEMFNKIHTIAKTLSGFNKEQTTKFIDEVTTHARMEGYDIPDPEDKKALDLYNFYKERGII